MSLPPTGPREPRDPFERPDHEAGEPRDAHDPVAAFFAAEREDVQPLAADDLRWQRITREARGRRRTGPLRWAAAAAAILLVGGGVATVVGQHRTEAVASAPRPTVTRTVYVDPTPTGAASSASTAPSTATGVPGVATTTAAAGVPADFRLVSVSSVASGRLWGLGSAICSGQACALVVTSTDRGATWSVAGQVPGVTAGAARPVSGSGAPGIGAASNVTDVRFADDRTGWVFGAQTLRTTDGGRTWTTYAHGGGPVLALETDGKDVVLAAADECSATLCTGGVTVSRATVGASSASTVGTPYGVGQGFLGLEVAWRARTAYVSAVGADTSSVPVAVGTSSVTPLGGPECSGSGAGRGPFVATADGAELLGFCTVRGGAPAPTLVAPQSSTDGSTWTPGPAGATVSVGDGPLLVAAAADGQRLVVASWAPVDGSSGVLVSFDGGASWAAPTSLSAPAGGFGWVGAAGGGTYLALPAVPDGSFWRSTDAGRTWTQVRVVG